MLAQPTTAKDNTQASDKAKRRVTELLLVGVCRAGFERMGCNGSKKLGDSMWAVKPFASHNI
jgi:hypothetical protein